MAASLTDRERDVLALISQNPLVSQLELAEQLGTSRSAVAGHVMRLTEKGALRGRGYVLNDPAYLAVVGGANVDIEGRSTAPLVAADSNPGTVTRAAGGVSRNIANNLANLGAVVRLVTVLGRDPDGTWLHEITAAAGVDMSEVVWSNKPTSSYLSLLDADGELAYAVNDMHSLDDLDAAAIEARSSTLDSAQVVVADCNLTPEALTAVAARANTLFVDTVSAAKANRIAPHLDQVHTLKPNKLEAQILTDVNITNNRSLRRAANSLLERGVQRVVISLGAQGALVADEDGIATVPALAAGVNDVVSVTGAGDALMAGLVLAHLRDLPAHDAVRFGLATASISATSAAAVNSSLSEAAVLQLVEEGRQ